LKFGTLDGHRHYIAKTPIACENERMPKHPNRPRDPAQLAKLVVDIATGESADKVSPKLSAEDLREASRRGGLKGGTARAGKLSGEQRAEIAKGAAKARWHGGGKSG
jgi:hypothetical protein